MHKITELPAWERLFKRIVWKQIGEIEGKRILDFGSGEGITANYFAEKNEVIAIEPSQEMLTNAWKDYQYTQIMGDVKTLSAFADKTFDIIICHNVLEYVDNKEEVIKVLTRVLKQDGILSIVKHNRPGRVMQMAVLLDDFEKANAILDGIFALIKPVTTSTDGRCVAITKCIPAALAFCANLQIASSTSPFATIIKSANSSTIITICGSFPKLSSFSITSL